VVPRPDRKELLSYLYGETQTSSSIDKNAPLEITMQRPQPFKKQQQQQQQRANTQQSGSTFAAPTLPVQQQSDSRLVDQSAKKHKLDDFEKQSTQTFHEHIKNKIKQQQNTSNLSARIIDNSITDLSKELTAEKITSLKAKYLAKKRKTIIGGENDEELVNAQHMGASDSIDIDNDLVTKDILSRERVWRTRVTILESNGKEFDKNIFAILQSVKLKEEGIGGYPGAYAFYLFCLLSKLKNQEIYKTIFINCIKKKGF
jgi:parafibromin